ncbi:tetratricopeptide repeat protein [Micromonospora rifamycinica]|uniref:tetratricopeptide repeat protein n=1 Tax=Micromonospora rifamycinica TaxID=291594 RepID=UPI002E2C700E|nr:tetratricopeptide repeat protein [Micromonospora rifamycinica]
MDGEVSGRGRWEALAAHRVAEVLVVRRDGTPGRGSGYRVRDDLVLTAAHVVTGGTGVTVRFDAEQPGEWSAPGTVAWCDPTADVALVRLARVDGVSVVPVRFGRLTATAQQVPAHVVGFPRWKLRTASDGVPVREAHHAVGSIAGLSNPKSRTLEVRVDPPAADPEAGVSPWEAMSGAAVWVAGCVVGVVSAHHRREGLGFLTAVRIEPCFSGRDGPGELLGPGVEPLVDVLAENGAGAGRVVTEPAAADLVLRVGGDGAVELTGGQVVVSGRHRGVSPELADAVARLVRARADLVGVRGAGAAVEDPVGVAAGAVGRLLAADLLPEAVVTGLRQEYARARARDLPVRLGVQVDGELARLPWETLWLPGEASALALDGGVRLYRRVGTGTATPTGGPLRIVVAISSPLSGGGGLLDYERELRNVVQAVRGARAHEAEVRIVHFATTREIRAALTEWPAHVLHLSGHGGPGVLELEDETGAARRVDVGTFVREAIPVGRMPPVVVLAACYTGAEAGVSSVGGGSFAAGLLAAGASVVIASQTAITDVYATRMFAKIYENVAADPGADVIAAAAQARREVQQELEQSTVDGAGRWPGLGEWAAVSVLAGVGWFPVLDPARPGLVGVTTPTAAGVLRRQPGDVVGRRWEQRRLPARLLGRSTAGVVLHGVGGVGKTTLADELIARIVEADTSRLVAVVRNQVGVDEVITAILDAVTDALRISRPVWASPVVLAGLRQAHDGNLSWRRRLEILDGQVLPTVPVLLVVDNFEDNLTPAGDGGRREVADPDLAALLARLAASAGAARLLVTSRYRFTLPEHAEYALTFQPVGPLSAAETLKLAWALPQLDRLDEAQLDQVWRAVGGHPRCLEYLDALLAGGQARFADVRIRLLTAAADRLAARGHPAVDIDRYLSEHGDLDAALAETAALAADDVLLDDLLAQLDGTPHARALLWGASVYRRAVDHHALAFQLGVPDPHAANTAAVHTARQAVQDILTRAQVPPGPIDLARLPASVRALLDPHLTVRPTPPVRVEVDLAPPLGACTASSLLTATTPDGQAHVFVHRWTASELHRREQSRGDTTALTRVHRRAADYWRWRVAEWPQSADQDIDDLREAHHHYQQAHLLGDTTMAAELATIAWTLEVRLSRLGRRAEALAYCQHAVALKRDLARADEPTHIRDLAGFLNNLGIRLSELGRREEALAATTEAVEVYRRLAAVDSGAFDPGLGMALNNLGTTLAGLGRWAAALTATTEAVAVRRRLAAADPEASEADLAMSLNNLGAVLSGLGRWAEALAATTEAVEVRRRLAAVDPEASEPYLAASLGNLGIRLSRLGRRAEALTAITEAVEVYQRLAAGNPGAFEPDLAKSLSNLGAMLSELGRWEEALTATTEAAEVYRRLAAVSPGAFEPDLGMALNNLGAMLSELGRWAEALGATTEAVEIRRRLAAVNPGAFEPDLATSLSNLGIRLSELGRREEALAPATEAVEVYRRLAAVNRAFEPNLATSLNNLGVRLSELGRWREALTATTEAVEVRRRLIAVNPDAFEPDLAMSLNNLGAMLAGLGRVEEALTVTSEAVEVRRRLVEVNPGGSEPDLAVSLRNLGDMLASLGRWAEASAALTEAVGIYRRRSAQRPAIYTRPLRASLKTLADVLVNLGRHDEANGVRREIDGL